jgi:Outer membrane protein beta-barrel domain
MKRLGLVILAVALCVVATRPAMAQGHLRYGVSAGLLLPLGDYGKADKMGWVGGAGATYWLPGTGNIGVRGDVSYSTTSHDPGPGNSKIIGGMASFVYALNPASAPARIMVTAGVGYFNLKDSEVTTGSVSKVGFGGGLAVAFKLGLSSTRLVVGSRFTNVSTTGGSTTFLPLTVGLSFGK